MKIRILLLSIAYLFVSISVDGQVSDQVGAWLNISLNNKYSNSISSSHMYSWRRIDGVKNWQQSLLRNGINYHKENMTMSVGFDWVVTWPYGEQPILAKSHEYRPFEQLSFKHSAGRFKVTHRYRIEQRVLDQPSLTDDQQIVFNSKFRNRARYKLSVVLPLIVINTDQSLLVKASNEAFVNFGQGTKNHVFDQNWFYVALGYKHSSNWTIELGYQNQYIIKSSGLLRENNHQAQVSIKVALDSN